MGFRSYIRELLGAFLMLFRPPLPWCFPIREVPSEQKESQEQEQQQQEETGGNRRKKYRFGSSSSRRKREEKVAKIFVFCGFQKLH